MAEGWLTVSVYRNAEGCDGTLGGVTSQAAQLYVPHPGGPIENPPEALRLVPGDKGGQLNFVPVALDHAGSWSMFGGNFVFSSDGRFVARYGAQPVAVHDRVEK